MLNRPLWPFGKGSKQEKGKEKTGLQGEDIAVSFLKTQGYNVVARNYRQRFGELDIIAKDGETFVFIEVKTRKNDRYGNPFEAVDSRKQIKLSRMAQDYISRNGLEDKPARFDVVAILLTPGSPPKVEHIRDAFEFQE